MLRSWMVSLRLRWVVLGIAGSVLVAHAGELPPLEAVKIGMALLSHPTDEMALEIYQSGALSFDYSEAEEKFTEIFNAMPPSFNVGTTRSFRGRAVPVTAPSIREPLKKVHEQLKSKTVAWIKNEGMANLLYPQGAFVAEKIFWLDDDETPELFSVIAFLEENFHINAEPLVFVRTSPTKKGIRPSVYLYNTDAHLFFRPLIKVEPGQGETFSPFRTRVRVYGAERLLDRFLKEIFLSNAVLAVDSEMLKQAPDAYSGAVLHSYIHYHQQLKMLKAEKEVPMNEEAEAIEIAKGWKTLQKDPAFQEVVKKETLLFAGNQKLALDSLRKRYVDSNIKLARILHSKEEQQALGAEVCFLNVVRGLSEVSVTDLFLESNRLFSLALEYRVSQPEPFFARALFSRHIHGFYAKCSGG